MEKLTFGSLFAGIGGFDLGFERAGMTCMWQVEIDPFCLAMLSKHWPDVPKYENVMDCGKHNLKTVDVICGGFPCQDISKSSKGEGLDGERSGLWFEYQRIIGEMRPRWVIIENVKNIYNRGFEKVLAGLWEIGYDAEWSIISACAFGASHTRERMFVVAYPNSERRKGDDSKKKRVDKKNRLSVFDRTQHDSTGRFERTGCITGNGDQPHNIRDGLVEIARLPPWPKIKPGMDRVAYGVPGGVDRLRGLGNAVAPQKAEWIGCRIITMHRALMTN